MGRERDEEVEGSPLWSWRRGLGWLVAQDCEPRGGEQTATTRGQPMEGRGGRAPGLRLQPSTPVLCKAEWEGEGSGGQARGRRGGAGEKSPEALRRRGWRSRAQE